MTKIFIKTLEASLLFALLISLQLAYYKTQGNKKRQITLLVSVFVGVIMAIVSSVIREIPNFINRVNFDFYSCIPIVVSCIMLIILYSISEKKRDKKLYNTLVTVFFSIYIISLIFYYMPRVFTQLNNFVYYGESAFSTIVLYRIIGYFFGVLLSFLAGLSIYKTAKSLHEKELRGAIIIALILGGITQLNVIVTRLYSLSIIPRNDILFKIIAFISNHENYINFAIFIFLIIIPVTLILENRKVKRTYDNPAELRKEKYHMKVKRHWGYFSILMLFLSIFSLTYIRGLANREVALSEPEEYEMENGMIVVPLDLLEDMHLHRYLYTAKDGTHMRFFLIKKSEGSYGVVLDACEICGDSGYYERKDDVICKLCDVVMNRGTIGFKGGCNPIPFPYMVHDKKIIIKPADLDDLSHWFSR